MIQKINDTYDRLSSSEKKIADFFVEHEEDVLSLSIHELAAKIGVSSPTISRFSRKVFNSNFSQLKIEMARTAKERSIQESFEILEWAAHFEDLPVNLMAGIDKALTEVQKANAVEAYTDVIQVLKESENIYLFGIGNSGLVAQDLMQKLIKLKKRAFYIGDSNFSVISSLLCTPKDAVFAVSSCGCSKEVILAARKAKEMGAKVIAMTSDKKSPLGLLGDMVLVSPKSRKNNLRLGAAFARHGQLYIIDMLYIGLAQKLTQDPDVYLADYQSLLVGLKEGASS